MIVDAHCMRVKSEPAKEHDQAILKIMYIYTTSLHLGCQAESQTCIRAHEVILTALLLTSRRLVEDLLIGPDGCSWGQ